MDKEKLENAIKEYLTKHVRLSVICDPEGDGHVKVSVGLWLDNDEIANSSDIIILP